MKGLMVVAMMATGASEAKLPIVAPPPPPPVILASPTGGAFPREVGVIDTIDVTVSAGRETLWSGVLHVNAMGANYSESLRQALEPCGAKSGADRPYLESQRQLNVSINRRGGREAPDVFNVNVNWTRPAPDCESGSRGVTFTQRVEIAPGRTVRLAGDGGLAIALTRHVR